MVTDVVERADSETGELLSWEPYRFPEVRIDKKFVMLQQGRDFVLSDGLLDGLHQLSGGYFDVETKIEQLPNGETGQTCVVSATVTVFHPEEGRVLRRAGDIGDASPASVGRTILPHLIRMASTRAVSRALRTLLNVGAVAFEELGPSGAEPAAAHEDARSGAFDAPVTRAPAETIQIDGRTFNRPQVLTIFRSRLEEAKRAGLQLAPVGSQGGPPAEDARLSELVAFSGELKRRLEARAGARSSGK